jgi:hypothetical protein
MDNYRLLEEFLTHDCSQYERTVLLSAMDAKAGRDHIAAFNFNRFNIRLDFGQDKAVIDDELNPADGECIVSIDLFRKRLEQ